MYVELHSHSAYSFHDGVSQPHELAGAAANLGYGAFALTDHDGVHGAMEFAHACLPLGVRPILGAELTLADGHHLTLIVENRTGWSNLCRLLTTSYAETRSQDAARSAQQPEVTIDDLLAHSRGLICLSGCAARGAVAGRIERSGGQLQAAAAAHQLLDGFGRDRLRIELQRPFARHDRARNHRLIQLAGELRVPTVATGNVHAHSRTRVRLQDVFVALQHNATLDETEPLRRGNSSHVLVSPQAMAERFAEYPRAVAETAEIAARIDFDITSDLGYRYPGSDDDSSTRRLNEICRQRLVERYGDNPNGGSRGGNRTGSSARRFAALDERGRARAATAMRGDSSNPTPGSVGRRRVGLAEARARLEAELAMIDKLNLSGFFLIHHELLELAREIAIEVRGPSAARSVLPPGRGRGSSVSSIVCYLTGLSHVDPLEAELCLSRFLHEDITSLPDIDLDFPRDIRKLLIPRIHERYGRRNSALVSAFSTYRTRGSLRGLGKALGLPVAEIERVIRTVDNSSGGETIDARVRDSLARSPGGARLLESPRWQAMLELLPEIHRLPRHVSQHSGGMVISTDPLVDLCPVMPVAMPERQIVQWDKDSCADAGFVKIDLLGLGMLSSVERTVDLIHGARGEIVDLSRIPLDDPETFRQIRRAETTGVFQIESRAQMQMLVRSQPETLSDIFTQVAIVRPGPIIGGAVNPYLERRKQLRLNPDYEVPYAHPLLEPVLRDTLGAIVFQDQVIEVAIAVASFTPGEAEGLRRAMSRKRSHEALAAYYERFLEGSDANGVSEKVAKEIFAQIIGFSGFGFPKSHSAAFGLLAYQTSWLRCHYGPEFVCGLLNEQPMGFYLPDALIHEAQRRGIRVLDADVNASGAECSVEWLTARRAEAKDGRPLHGPLRGELAIRIGLGYVKGVREDSIHALIQARAEGGTFVGVADLAGRSGADTHTLERLAWAGACDSLGPNGRREALWLLGAVPAGEPVVGGAQLALPIAPLPAPKLRELTAWDQMIADYGSTGLTTGTHPLALLRDQLTGAGAYASDQLGRLPEGQNVTVGGLVVARQRPGTAKGVVFVLLEDEVGVINVILSPPIYKRFRAIVRSEPLLEISGRLERRTGALNLIATRVSALSTPDDRIAVRRIGEESDLRKTGENVPAAIESEDFASERKVAAQAADLRAVAPVGINFGRRGR